MSFLVRHLPSASRGSDATSIMRSDDTGCDKGNGLQDSKAGRLAFSERAVMAGSNLRLSQLVRGVGGARDGVLCTTEDGREVVALASEWPRVDVLRSADGSLGTVTRTTPDSRKIALYRPLFRDREDAYASGYLRKDGRMGYGPACSNAWKPGLCDRRHVGCDKCENRSPHEMSDDAFKRHFKGVDPLNCDVLGLYPMTRTSTCWSRHGWRRRRSGRLRRC